MSSFWRRLFGPSDPPPPPTPAIPAPAAPRSAPTPQTDPAGYLGHLADDAASPLEPEMALDAFERLRDDGDEARAIDLLRAVLAPRPLAPGLGRRLAEVMAARGDDRAAAGVLGPLLDAETPELDVLMLGAEIAERSGDLDGALALYERVVARDLDYPRARSRVARLRDSDAPRDAGATLMADGAMARGRYRVESELGRGGAGTVFLAADLQLSRPVALKVYHRRGRTERVRLLVEARVPAQLEHPGVIRIFDLDETLGAISMERVRGGSVRNELRKGAVTRERLVRWFRTAAEAVRYVHGAGFVHRDLKPSNFLLRDDDRVVLTDFGLAALLGSTPRAGEGTLAYMSPEQRDGHPVAPAHDLYALGVSLAEVLGQLSDPRAEHVALAAALRDPAPDARPGLDEVLARLR